MILKNSSINDFVDNICNNKELVLFGAGVLSNIFVMYFKKQNKNINIKYIVDNDMTKIGRKIEFLDYEIKISDPAIMKSITNKKVLVLITSSYYYDIIKQLNRYNNLNDVECYILPIMYTTHLKAGKSNKIAKSDTMLIPKKIHYMWFGNKELPTNLKKCIDSWKKYCPEYEIIRWDESNYDISKCEYTKQAYERQEWGFVTDYARFDILYHYGGVYMDTDVELIRNIDDMLYQKGFTSVEKWQVINFGGCCGAIPYNKTIGELLEARRNVKFIKEDGSLNKMSSGYYETIPFIDKGYIINGNNQLIGDINIYTYDYFHPYDYMSAKLEVTENTYGIHHFNGGWIDNKAKIEREITQKRYYEILNKMKG